MKVLKNCRFNNTFYGVGSNLPDDLPPNKIEELKNLGIISVEDTKNLQTTANQINPPTTPETDESKSNSTSDSVEETSLKSSARRKR